MYFLAGSEYCGKPKIVLPLFLSLSHDILCQSKLICFNWRQNRRILCQGRQRFMFSLQIRRFQRGRERVVATKTLGGGQIKTIPMVNNHACVNGDPTDFYTTALICLLIDFVNILNSVS